MLRSHSSRFGRPAGLATLLAIVLYGIGLAGCATGSSANNPPPPVLPTSAAISICNQTASGCSSGTTFSLGVMRDLSVSIQWSHVSEGTHSGTVEVLDPNDGLYQAQNISFAVDSADANAQSTVNIPVAGTFITQREITGDWKVRLSLDHQPMGEQTVQFQP